MYLTTVASTLIKDRPSACPEASVTDLQLANKAAAKHK